MNDDKKDFVHLHLHTEYSLLDGSGKIKNLVKRAKELGMKSMAITDHGVMYGCVDFYKACIDEGIKPILGCEVYVASKSMEIKRPDKDNRTNHLVLLVKNEKGYENLMKIVSDASIEGFYYKPRIDHEYLRKHSEGLIALSACLGGEVQRNLLADNYKEAKNIALEYKDIFKEGFYLELQNHNVEEQRKVNELNIKLARETDIPLVATNDVHYIYKEDSKAHDILMCIQTGKSIDDEDRRRYPSDQFYLKSPSEMYDIFSYVEEALENTIKIAEECNFNYEFHVSKLPKFPLPTGENNPSTFLRDSCYRGLIRKYDFLKDYRDKEFNYEEIYSTREKSDEAKEIIDRLEYELGVINQMGYVDYFLIVGDFIKYSVDNGIPTGPGRGCFLPDTNITLEDGSLKKIKEFKGGETVLTAYGNLQKVENKMMYDIEEEIITIYTADEELNLTSDHKVLSIQTKEYTNQLQWNEADKLKKNDFVVYPIPKEETIEKSFDLVKLVENELNVNYTEEEIWYETENTKLKTGSIHRKIKLDNNLCKVIGYFISKGHTIINNDEKNYSLGFEFSSQEKKSYEEVLDLFFKVFKAKGKIKYDNANQSVFITIDSKIILEFFKLHCVDNDNNKKISKDILKGLSKENIEILVSYIFRCDGNYLDTKYIKTSKHIKEQLKYMLARLGYYASFKTKNSNLEYSVSIYKDDEFYKDEDYIYIKIKDVEKKEYKGKVYDLSIPGDTSYVANSIGVHNSAAGSIVAYTLDITKIDPLKYSLLFERFLNPERVSMPDIDSDFCYERRQEVIDYVVDKYGKKNVSQIITFGTMAARACIRDVGRAMNYPYAEVDRIAKMIPTMLGITIEKALDLNPELKTAYDTEERVKNLIDVSKNLEGLPRHSSTHAAGVVIASKPLVEYVPLQRNDEMIVTQFGMNTLEELGLLKMDFLGLRTLTVMSDAIKMIKINRGIDIDLDKIDTEDKEVYKMIGEGKTAGVFQLESAGMVSFMKELKPDSLEDIIAGISLYRPGPMAEIPNYIARKRDPSKVKYLTPELEDILDVTYGVMVYQEQVMEIVRKLAGYSMGRSDLVRRAMSKKKHSVMEAERKNFVYGIVNEKGEVEVPGCVRNGVSEEAANKIYDMMMDFAAYAFNKSHAAAYGIIGYQTAFLMKYYPVEMIAAMLNSVIGTSEKVAHYIKFAESVGIQVVKPTINKSYTRFTVDGDKIIFGLAAIRNVGVNVCEGIVKSRKEKGEFTSIVDFIEKIDLGTINKRAVESLIKAGALDSFNVYRSKMLGVYEKVMDGVSNDKKRNIDGQISLFNIDTEDVKAPEVVYPNINEFTKKHILSMEKEMTGIYLSGHPLDEYKKSIEMQTSVSINTILESHKLLLEEIQKGTNDDTVLDNIKIKDNQTVILGGILNEVNQKVTRNNTIMAFLKLEDLSGEIEVIVFPRTLDRVRDSIKQDGLVTIRGRVSIKEDEMPKLICEKIDPLEKVDSNKIYIKAENAEHVKEINRVLKNNFKEYKGETPVYVFDARVKKSYRLSKDTWINLESDALINLRTKFGDENIKVIES